jgi:DUF4097 and DUF4098 domain-containing protein YvlB
MKLFQFASPLLAVLALAVLASPVHAQNERSEKLLDRTFAAVAGQRLEVVLSTENVRIESTNESHAQVEVRGRGRDIRSELQRRNITMSHNNGVLSVRAEPRYASAHRNGRDARFEVVIRVPERFNASVTTTSGDVRLTRLAGDVSITTASGNVTADVLYGEIVIVTASGDGTVRTATGPSFSFTATSGDFRAGRVDTEEFVASTSSGDITVQAIRNGASVRTGSGDVRIGVIGGTLAATTASGHVRASMAQAADVSITSGSGDIGLVLPRGLDADVEFRGSTVRLADAFVVAGTVNRREVEGQIGDGGTTVRVRSGNGQVTIAAR